MQIKPEEISKVIKDQIEGFETATIKSQEGIVIQVGDGIAHHVSTDGVGTGLAGQLESPGRVPHGPRVHGV